jgi:lipid II:glycine glycyltransferase (peptidoglycan interpeptide bridge formation enzyme)/ribosomal protein S18 acetylase RimI-like enzyme
MLVREVTAREEWNSLVSSLPDHDLYQAYEWGEVRSSQGWAPRRFAFYDASGCAAAVSLLVKRLPASRSVLYAPSGPLLRHPGDAATWDSLVATLREIAGSERAAFLRIDRAIPRDGDEAAGGLGRHGFVALPEDWTTWNIPRIVMRMDISASDERIKQGLRRRYREYIATADRRGLSVRRATAAEEGARFRQALAAVGQRRGQPVRSRAYFERLWREYIRTGHGVLLLAEHRGRVVGGLLGARFGRRAHMLYVVARDSAGAARLHQAPSLYWEFVRWAKGVGCDTVDWGGIATHMPPLDNDPGYGLYQFKLGFNAKIEHLAAYQDLVFSPGFYSAFRFLERRVAAVAWTWRGRLNPTFDRIDSMHEGIRRKGRQFAVGVRQRGMARTIYWGAFGFLRPNRFLVFVCDLHRWEPAVACGPGMVKEIWDSVAVGAYRRSHPGLPPEFYQDEIDGVEQCSVVRINDEVAGLIWIYHPEDASRLFRFSEAEFELNNGFVLPPYRGRGVFKIAIAAACESQRSQGAQRALAMVHASNVPSRAAFEAVGFRPTASLRHFLFYRPRFRAGPSMPRVSPEGSPT